MLTTNKKFGEFDKLVTFVYQNTVMRENRYHPKQ